MRKKQNERGTALMFALFVLVILSTGTALLWKQLHGNLEQQRRSWHKEQSLQLAEAGLERAIAELRAAPEAYRGSEAVALGSGVYTVRVTPDDTAGGYVLESHGKLEGAAYPYDHSVLRGTVRLSPGGQVLSYTWEPLRGVNR